MAEKSRRSPSIWRISLPRQRHSRFENCVTQVNPSCTLAWSPSTRVEAAQGPVAVVLGDILTTLSIFKSLLGQGLQESPRVGKTAWHLSRHSSVLHTRASGQGQLEPIGFQSPHFRKPTTEACDQLLSQPCSTSQEQEHCHQPLGQASARVWLSERQRLWSSRGCRNACEPRVPTCQPPANDHPRRWTTQDMALFTPLIDQSMRPGPSLIVRRMVLSGYWKAP